MTRDGWYVVILTYNRPELLGKLVDDLVRETVDFGAELRVDVFDDYSTADYFRVRGLVESMGWGFHRYPPHMGKTGHGLFVTNSWTHLRDVDLCARVALLPDDVRLCRDYFRKAWDLWESIDFGKKATLTTLLTTSREYGPNWTGFSPGQEGRVMRTQWVDGLCVCPANTLKVLGYRVPPIDTARRKLNPNLSTGVGQAISRNLHAAGYGMYSVTDSLCWHDPGPSQMNPVLRKSQPLETIRFVDPDILKERPSPRRMPFIPAEVLRQDPMAAETWDEPDPAPVEVKPPPVVASLASIPQRAEHLQRVVASLVDQVDEVLVSLNGYECVPKWMDEYPKVRAFRPAHDLGDAEKFRQLVFVTEPSYVLTCDDDLVYPADYARTMVDAIERYGRRAVVGIHGVFVNNVRESYYKQRKVHHWRSMLKDDRPVHLLGTGALAFYGPSVPFGPHEFHSRNMADIWFGIICQRREVPCVQVAHRKRWLTLIDVNDTIFEQSVDNDGIQTGAVLATRWMTRVAAREA